MDVTYFEKQKNKRNTNTIIWNKALTTYHI